MQFSKMCFKNKMDKTNYISFKFFGWLIFKALLLSYDKSFH